MGKSADLVVGLVMLDKFSKTFDKFNRDVANSEKKSAGFGKALSGIGAAVSVGAVAAFGTSAVKAYGDALQSQQLLMDAFAKQPQLMGYNVEALMAYNKELSTKIAYDDDEINKAQANLALFKLTGDQIKNLTPLVADLARRKGVDLATAATSVGKAMQGQARGLKDLGINFKSTGDTAKDYLALQSALQQQVGGTAEAFAQGNPLGQMQNMQIAFGNMQESIGQALVPAMTAFTNVMTPLAGLIGSIPGPMLQIGIAIGVASLAARVAGPMLMSLATSFKAGAISAGAVAKQAPFTAASLMNVGIAAETTTVATRGMAGAMAAAGTAGKGLMASLGGPIGLAIVGVTTAISLFTLKSDSASSATEGWTQSLQRQNGVLDENSRLTIAQKLADEGVLAAVDASGIGVKAYTDALISGGSAREDVITQLRTIAEAHAQKTRVMQADTNYTQDQIYAEQAAADAATLAADKLAQYGGELDTSTRNAQLFSTAADQATVSVEEQTKSVQELYSAMNVGRTAAEAVSGAFGNLSQASLRSAIAADEEAKALLRSAYAMGKIADTVYLAEMAAINNEQARLNGLLRTSLGLFGDLSDTQEQASTSTDTLTKAQQNLLNTLSAAGQALSLIHI